MSLTPKGFFKATFFLQVIVLLGLLVGLTYSDNWSVVTTNPRQQTIFVFLLLSVLTILLASFHLRDESYYPRKLFRRILTFLLFYYLVLGYTQDYSISMLPAFIVALFLPMPSILILTTVSAVSIIAIYRILNVAMTSEIFSVSTIPTSIVESFYYVDYFLPTIAFGFIITIVACFFLKGKENFEAYPNNYSFIVGIVTSLLSVQFLFTVALLFAIYNAINRMFTHYGEILHFEHVKNAKGYVHYLEYEGMSQFKNIMKENLGKATSYLLNSFKLVPKNYGSHRSFVVRFYVAVFMLSYASLSFVFRVTLSVIFAVIHYSLLMIIMAFYTLTKKIVSIRESNFRQKHGVRVVCGHCYHEDDLPYYQCHNCRQTHDIRPGSFGVFKYRCGCGTKLPNTFKQGRHQLKAFCKACGNEYLHQESAPVIVPIIGETAVGKTTHMINGIRGILTDTADRGMQCGFISNQQTHNFAQLANNQPEPTVTKDPQPTTLHFVKNQKKPSSSLHVFDSAGSAYDSLEEIRRLNYLHLADGFVFLLDGKHLNDEFSGLGDTLERLIIYWQKESNEKSETKLTTPIAFVFNQIDAVELGDFRPESIKQWLNANGFGDLVRKIEMTFETYEFFTANSKTVTGEYSADQAYNWLMNRQHQLNLGGIQ